jgi:outer membrane lipoprotein LolB
VTRRLAAAAVLALASGCTALPPTEPPGDWPAQRAALQALDRWALDGRIAVAAGEEGFSGGFDWTQAGERADIEFSGPLGGTGFEVHLEGDRLTLVARGETYADDEARAYIADRFGTRDMLPIREMRYWLVGAPAPGSPYEETLAEDRRLAALAQSGWQVRYDRYQGAGSLSLPARMEMTTPGLRLRVIASGWRLLP